MDTPDLRGRPLWRWIALGWMAAAATAAWTWNPSPPAELLAEELERHEPVWEPEELSERELRALPAIGPARAADLVETRWSRPPQDPPALEDVPGIGPHTASRARSFLDQRRRPPRPPLPVLPPVPGARFGSMDTPVPPPRVPRASRRAPGSTLLPHDPATDRHRRASR